MIGIRNRNSCKGKYFLYPRPVSVFTQDKSKFLSILHSHSFASCCPCSVSRQVQGQCRRRRVWCLADWKSVTVVQKRFGIGHGRETLPLKCIRFRDKELRTTRDPFMWKISGKSTDAWIRRGSYHRKAFRRIPHASVCAASNQLSISRSAVHQILHETLQHLTRFDYFKCWNRLTQCPQHASKHVDSSISSVPWGVPRLKFTKIVVAVAILSGSEF